MKHVFQVKELIVRPLKTFPRRVELLARGLVPTGGWTNPQLQPRVFFLPPADGILPFDFVAEPPTGLATQVISKVEARLTFEPPLWARGVRVIAEANGLVATLGPAPALKLKAAEAASAPGVARPVDLDLVMRLDADVSPHECLVTLEGKPVGPWKPVPSEGHYVCPCPEFPVNGPLDVFASARSRNHPQVADALVLTLKPAGGAEQTLRVSTHNFKGRASVSFDV